MGAERPLLSSRAGVLKQRNEPRWTAGRTQRQPPGPRAGRRPTVGLPAAGLWLLAACTSPAPSSQDAERDSQPAAEGSAAAEQPAGARPDTVGVQPADTVDRYFEGSRRVWEDARDRGVAFRAVGQEPGWVLEITDGRTIELRTNYGEDEVVLPTPSPATVDGAITYHAVTETNDLRVVIRELPCTDTMSGERFSMTVEVLLDGASYKGCGRRLDRLP